jgi:glycosyltransferase involved in cell wall biosynthesis
LFEYLGAGIPTIGPDTSAVREVFEDNVHLRLVKQDGSDFVTAILDMKNNAALRVALGKEGQRLVLDEFTWERNAERVVQYIQQNPQRTVQLASDR